MKKLGLGLVVILFSASAITARAGNMDHVAGRILLQVEERGEAWYVAPDSVERVYIKDGEAAYAALRTFGLGITNEDLKKIPVGIEDRFQDVDADSDGLSDYIEEAIGTAFLDPDSDADGYLDGEEIRGGYNPLGEGRSSIDAKLGDRLRGYILLQVESRGEAWYVHPDDGKRYYMKNGDAAYQIMRYLSLGITNADLAAIPLLSESLDCDDSLSCLLGALESGVPASVAKTITVDLFGAHIVTDMQYVHLLPGNDGRYTFEMLTEKQWVNGVEQSDVEGLLRVCTYEDKSDMIAALNNWISLQTEGTGTISTSEMDFATCTDSQL